MSSRRVRLTDVPEIPSFSDDPLDAPQPVEERPDPDPWEELEAEVRLTTLGEFADVDEPTADPLLGSSGETVIPVGGDVIAYGTGGAGKTTLSIDAAFHLVAGQSWLGIDVPRPTRLALIENEGPRGKFRLKLRAKLAGWNGDQELIRQNAHVLEEPWGGFTFAEARHREHLAAQLIEHESDLLLCGPVSTLGMIGGGTPDEINAFVRLLAQTRALLERPLAVWLIHHENRAGQVSGAWERVPDCLLHVTSRGNGHTRVYVQKARWSSELHATTLQLTWTDGYGFAVEQPDEAITPERVYDDIAAFVFGNGGSAWNEVRKHVPGNDEFRRLTRDRMLAEGVLLNAGGGHRFVLWHRDDPARPHDLLDEQRPDHPDYLDPATEVPF